jgi:deoxyribodipyrimidine photolyase-like uncharacterized protein
LEAPVTTATLPASFCDISPSLIEGLYRQVQMLGWKGWVHGLFRTAGYESRIMMG